MSVLSVILGASIALAPQDQLKLTAQHIKPSGLVLRLPEPPTKLDSKEEATTGVSDKPYLSKRIRWIQEFETLRAFDG